MLAHNTRCCRCRCSLVCYLCSFALLSLYRLMSCTLTYISCSFLSLSPRNKFLIDVNVSFQIVICILFNTCGNGWFFRHTHTHTHKFTAVCHALAPFFSFGRKNYYCCYCCHEKSITIHFTHYIFIRSVLFLPILSLAAPAMN